MKSRLKPDVGRADDLAPLLGFVGNDLVEVGGRAGNQGAAEVGQPDLQLGIGEAESPLHTGRRDVSEVGQEGGLIRRQRSIWFPAYDFFSGVQVRMSGLNCAELHFGWSPAPTLSYQVRPLTAPDFPGMKHHQISR